MIAVYVMPECPIEAIHPDTDTGMEKWVELNAQYAKLWPNITWPKAPLQDADAWAQFLINILITLVLRKGSQIKKYTLSNNF